MELTHQYANNAAHSPGWWAVFLTLMILAVLGMMAMFLVGVSRAYRQPAKVVESQPRGAGRRHA